jgi:hypothetical protein
MKVSGKDKFSTYLFKHHGFAEHGIAADTGERSENSP